jgi:hypothetical protein
MTTDRAEPREAGLPDRERALARLETIQRRIESRIAYHLRLQGWILGFALALLGIAFLWQFDTVAQILGRWDRFTLLLLGLFVLLSHLVETRLENESQRDLEDAIGTAAQLEPPRPPAGGGSAA